MDKFDPDASKKRSLKMMMASELEWKLKSKLDFIQYLDKQ
jgi:hypothetical protein